MKHFRMESFSGHSVHILKKCSSLLHAVNPSLTNRHTCTAHIRILFSCQNCHSVHICFLQTKHMTKILYFFLQIKMLTTVEVVENTYQFILSSNVTFCLSDKNFLQVWIFHIIFIHGKLRNEILSCRNCFLR